MVGGLARSLGKRAFVVCGSRTLERNGALQSKIDNLKSKLQDVTARRGAARGEAGTAPAGGAAQPPVAPATSPTKGQGLMGRLFGQGGR